LGLRVRLWRHPHEPRGRKPARERFDSNGVAAAFLERDFDDGRGWWEAAGRVDQLFVVEEQPVAEPFDV
jgi:hypothetical protein